MFAEMESKRLSNQSDQSVQTTSEESSKLEKYVGCKGVTLKDVLTMVFSLLIPAMIGILAVVLQKNEIDVTQKNRENDLYISNLQSASDNQRSLFLANESVFNDYVKNMVNVILYQADAVDSIQYNITRVLSINALRQLSLEKKKLLVQFLYDVEFAKHGRFIFNIDELDEDVKNLKGAILDNVDMSNNFDIPEIQLRSVSLINASFSNSNCEGADFSNSKLIGVNFFSTKLDGTRFINIQLQQTNFQGASLEYSQFIQANLTQSNITDAQISQALAVFNTILPNGTYARNKTFLINGDAREGLNGWNVTSGIIQVNNFYFTGNNNSTMVQRINASVPRLYSSYDAFDYCLSFLFYGQQELIIHMDFFDQNNKKLGVKNQRTSSSCNNNSSNSLDSCYWSRCNTSFSGTDYMDLKFIFGYNNSTNIIAIGDIEFTITAE